MKNKITCSSPIRKLKMIFPKIIAIFLLLIFFFPMAKSQVIAINNGLWNEDTTWSPEGVPSLTDEVVIPSGRIVKLVGDCNAKNITVNGKLMNDGNADFYLNTDFLWVHGEFAELEIGLPSNRYLGSGVINLTGIDDGTNDIGFDNKYVGASGEATLNLHGKQKNSWVKLAGNVSEGSFTITLSEPVNWEVDDEIVITSTRLDWNEAEKRRIQSISPDSLTISLYMPLEFPHTGITKDYTRSSDEETWIADIRAEVGLLSHNIVVQGDQVSEAEGYGGHVMMHSGGKAYFDGVELYRMGQKSYLGKYPFHWHMITDGGDGQYFKNSSVHLSYNRAITIHGTDFTTVENNFFYDHIGHGVFFEDGSERFNTVSKNVTLLSKKPAPGEEIIASDNSHDQFQNRTPSSYWITNPNNIIENNIAAGTEGTGYWFAFPIEPTGFSNGHPYFEGLEPYKEPLGRFYGNKAHSCMNGFDIFDQISLNEPHVILTNKGWANSDLHYMDSCTWYSNNLGVYAGIGSGGLSSNLIFRNNVFIDNRRNMMLASFVVIDSSALIFNSNEGNITGEQHLYRAYDGAGCIKNSYLVDWNLPNANSILNGFAAVKRLNHCFENITTNHTEPLPIRLPNYDLPPKSFITNGEPEHPRTWTMVFRDDGSVSNQGSSSIVSNHPLLLTGQETKPENWNNAYVNNHHYSLAHLTYNIVSPEEKPVMTIHRTKDGTDPAYLYYSQGFRTHHAVPLICNDDFLYTFYYETLPHTKTIQLRMYDAIEVGDSYVIRLKDFGKLGGININANNDQVYQYGSLAELKSATESGYFIEPNGDLYIRPIADSRLQDTGSQLYTLTWVTDFTPTLVDSDGDLISDNQEVNSGNNPFSASDMAFHFNEDSNFEGWTGMNNIENVTVACGSLSGSSINNGDAHIWNDNLNINAGNINEIIVKIRATNNTNTQLLWKNNISNSYSVMTIPYTGNGDWQQIVFDVGTHDEWNNIITTLRLDPVTNVGLDFDVDWIRAFNSENPIHDSDGDGMSDGDELSEGRNPFSASDMAFQFNEDGNFEGFSVFQNMENISVQSGVFSATSSTSDPYFYNSNVFLSADEITEVVVKLKADINNTTIQFFWKRNDTNSHYLITLPYSGNGNWQEIVFPVYTHDNWKGAINLIRVDPITSSGIDFEIDWIKANYFLVPNTILEHELVSGETITFEGQIITEAGEYLHTTQTEFGCDSIIQLNVTEIPAELFSNIDAECIDIFYNNTGEPSTTGNYLNDNGLEYFLYSGSDGEEPEINFENSNSGNKSIRCRINPNTDSEKERSEIVTSLRHEPYALKFGETKYYGQAFTFDEETPNNTNHFVLMQMVQVFDHSPRPVPFVIWCKVMDGNIFLRAEVADSEGVQHHPFDMTWIDIGPKSNWHNIVLKARPSRADIEGILGEIGVWVNGTLEGQMNLFWGYEDGPDEWRLSSGIYHPNSTDNANATVISILLDDIKLANTFDLANPANIDPNLLVDEIESISEEICQGEFYNFYGEILTESGLYSHTITQSSTNNCESVVYMDLTVLDVSECLDTDGDGVPDSMDLDDDNDGIPDTEECEELYVLSNPSFDNDSSWEPIGNGLSSGWILEDGVANVNPNINGVHFMSQEISGLNQAGGTITISFDIGGTSHASSEPNAGNGNAASFLIWLGCCHDVLSATTDSWPDRVSGIWGRNGAIVSHTEFVVSNDNNLMTQNVTVTIPYSGPDTNVLNLQGSSGADELRIDNIRISYNNCNTDSDGDGIVNSLDLDSDGDDCFDSLEGTMGYDSDLPPDGSFGTVSNDMGIPIVDGMEIMQGIGTGDDPNVIAQACCENNDVFLEVEICQGDSYPFDGNQLMESGTYFMYEELENGCTNTTKLHLIVLGSDAASCLDTDGDGVVDIEDLDDDNDGIPDLEENCEVASLNVGQNDWGTSLLSLSTTNVNEGGQTSLSNYLDDQGNGYNYISTIPSLGIELDVDDVILFAGETDNLGNPLESVYEFEFSEGVEASAIGIYIIKHSTSNSELSVSFSGETDMNTSFSVFDAESTGGIISSSGINPSTLEYNPFTGNINGPTNESFEGHIIGNSNALVTRIRLRSTIFSNENIVCVLYRISDCDSDGDGTVNSLDLDSDGDGCYDALEGTMGYDSDLPLDGSFGTVSNVMGIPIVEGIEIVQGIGASNDPNVIAQICCENNDVFLEVEICEGDSYPFDGNQLMESGTYFMYEELENGCTNTTKLHLIVLGSDATSCLDTDGDGIINTVDLDDDNDGIQDNDECIYQATNNGIWNESGVAVETNTSNATFYDWENIGSQPYDFDLTSSEFSGKAHIGSSYVTANGGNIFISFSEPTPINKIGLHFWGIWGSYQVGIEINGTVSSNDFNSIPSNSIGGIYDLLVSNCAIQLPTFDTTTGQINNDSNFSNCSDLFLLGSGDELVNNIRLTFQGGQLLFDLISLSCDTDNDMIPNYLDLDSDSDGCYDAEEGDGDYTNSDIEADGSFGTTSDINGVPINENGIAISQSIGNSQDFDVMECEQDFDSDGITDDIDLDDDNDGISDIDECGLTSSLYYSGTDIWKGETQTNVQITPNYVGYSTFGSSSFLSGVSGTETTLDFFQSPYFYNSNSSLTIHFDKPVKAYEIGIFVYDGIWNTGVHPLVLEINEGTATTLDFEVAEGILSGGNPSQYQNLGIVTYDASSGKINEGVDSVQGHIIGKSDKTVTSITISSFNPNNGIWLSIYSLNSCDQDNDGIVNRLDLDSDNDGCYDSEEGDNNIIPTNLTAEGSIGSMANEMGLPYFPQTSTDVFVQGVGVSQYQDIFCSNNWKAVEKSEEKSIMGHFYPNPTFSRTQTELNLKNKEMVSLIIYDALSNPVFSKEYGELPKGHQVLDFDTSDWKPGIYFVWISVGKRIFKRKIVVLRK